MVSLHFCFGCQFDSCVLMELLFSSNGCAVPSWEQDSETEWQLNEKSSKSVAEKSSPPCFTECELQVVESGCPVRAKESIREHDDSGESALKLRRITSQGAAGHTAFSQGQLLAGVDQSNLKVIVAKGQTSGSEGQLSFKDQTTLTMKRAVVELGQGLNTNNGQGQAEQALACSEVHQTDFTTCQNMISANLK